MHTHTTHTRGQRNQPGFWASSVGGIVTGTISNQEIVDGPWILCKIAKTFAPPSATKLTDNWFNSIWRGLVLCLRWRSNHRQTTCRALSRTTYKERWRMFALVASGFDSSTVWIKHRATLNSSSLSLEAFKAVLFVSAGRDSFEANHSHREGKRNDW